LVQTDFIQQDHLDDFYLLVIGQKKFTKNNFQQIVNFYEKNHGFIIFSVSVLTTVLGPKKLFQPPGLSVEKNLKSRNFWKLCPLTLQLGVSVKPHNKIIISW